MKILVTGGAGFIGYHTVRELLLQGHEITIIDDLSTGKKQNVDDLVEEFSSDQLEFIHANIINSEFLQFIDSHVKNSDVVMHLAAQSSAKKSVEAPLSSIAVNVMGFIKLLDACREHKKRLVYASSAAVYGWGSRGTDEIALSEYSVTPSSPLTPYGADKITNDIYAGLYSKLYGTSVIGLRHFNVYGPRSESGVVSKFIRQGLQYQPLVVYGDGKQTRNFIYVRDVAKINAFALTSRSNLEGLINVGCPGGDSTVNDLIRTLNKLMPEPVTVTYANPLKGDVLHSTPDLWKLESYVSGFEFTSLEQGLTETIKSMQKA